MSAYNADEEEGATSGTSAAAVSAFKRKEKLFKACANVAEAVSLGGALDLHRFGLDSAAALPNSLTLRTLDDCGVEFSFRDYPGVFVLCHCLDRRTQIELAHHSLRESLSPPNATNLHAHWDSSKRAQLDAIWAEGSPALDGDGDSDGDDESDEHEAEEEEAIARASKSKGGGKGGGREETGPPRGSVLSRVRWATLGYQYNWTERSYSKSRFVPFSAQLAQLAQRLAHACSSRYSLAAEAGIVNFYPDNQVMGGHRDDGEEALASPVVSVSIGPPCLFLLGGLDKTSEEPLPLVLRSGDVLVLGGEGRLRYHGVPRVWVAAEGCPAALHPRSAGAQAIHACGCRLFLRGDREGQGQGVSEGEGEGEAEGCSCGGVDELEVRRALKFLRWARINVNLRQVFVGDEPGHA